MEQPGTSLRRAWWLAGYLQLATVWVLSLAPSVPGPSITAGDKIGHFLAYFVMTLWFAQIVPAAGWRRLALLLIAMGFAIELLQIPLPNRSFSGWDAAANTAGVLVAWMVAQLGWNGALGFSGRVLDRWFGIR